jgi:hypothetical protein
MKSAPYWLINVSVFARLSGKRGRNVVVARMVKSQGRL